MDFLQHFLIGKPLANYVSTGDLRVFRNTVNELHRGPAVPVRAELELRQQRDLAQLYLDTAEVLLLGLDIEGRVTMINRNGCNLLGWTESELVGRDFIGMCLPERIRNEYKAKLHQLHAGLLPTSVNPVLTRSGTERRIEWHNTLLRDEFGGVTGSFSPGS